jgi:serine/threonine protein kinase
MSDSDKTHMGSQSLDGLPSSIGRLPESNVTTGSDSRSTSPGVEPNSKTAISNPQNVVSAENASAQVAHTSAAGEGEHSPGTAPAGPTSEAKPEDTDDYGVPLVNASDRTFIAKRVENSDLSRAMVVSSPQDLGRALEGTSLDHYQLDRFVGGGGMGAVFQAQDTRLGRVVAVKVLLRERADVDMVKRFQKEAQSAARLDHPNIARVYFVGENNGWNYIVFEYIEGRNLRQIVDDEGALPVERALDYTQQIAEALHHAAERDVVHRDIKPSNVLVSQSGQVKLVDMGLARLHQVAEGDEALTNTGVTLGTFDYISPEQAIEPRSADVRSDLYSLGCTLYFMLAQRPPFPDGTALQKMLRHNGDDPPDIRLFRPDVPEAVAQLVAKLLYKRPGDRYQTPAELIRAIQTLAQRLGLYGILRDGSGTSVALSRRATQRTASWTRFIPTVLAAAVILLGLFLWDFVSDKAAEGELRLPEQLHTAALNATGSVGTSSVDATSDNSKTTAGSAQPSHEKSTSVADTGKQGKTKGSDIGADADSVVAKTPRIVRDVRLGPPPGISGGIGAQPIDFLLSATGTAISRVGSSSGAGSTSPGSTKPAVSLIRIGGAARTAAEKEADSLDQAMSMARDLTGDTVIELADDRDEMLTSTIDLGTRSIVIRGGSGSRIVFRSNSETLSSNRHALGIQSSGKLKLEGLEFVLELKDRTESGWSLFRLAPGAAITCDDCVLTMRDQTGADIDPSDAGFFSVRSAEPLTMADDPGKVVDAERVLGQVPSGVSLSNCIVRGRATLLAMAQSSALTLNWTGGLFASSGSLIEAGPVPNDSSSKVAVINITLDRLTLVAPRGIARFKLNPKNEKVAIAVNMQYCAVAVLPAVALFEFSDLSSIPDRESMREKDWLPFFYRGSWNGCEADQFLRAITLKSAGTNSMVRDFQIDEDLPKKIRDESAWPTKVSLVRPASGHRLCATVATDFALEQPSSTYGHVPSALPQVTSEFTEPLPAAIEDKSGAGAIMPPDMIMPDAMP